MAELETIVYHCTKCDHRTGNPSVKRSGQMWGAYCPECGTWIKWMSKAELTGKQETPQSEPAPTPKPTFDGFETICQEMHELYMKKNHDYGYSFHQTFQEEGPVCARIRLSDKLNRFKALTLQDSRKVKDESIKDTLIDLACYSIMTIMEMEEKSKEEQPWN